MPWFIFYTTFNLVILEVVCPDSHIFSLFCIIARHFSFDLYILQVSLLSAGTSHFSCHHHWSTATYTLSNLLLDLNLNMNLNPKTLGCSSLILSQNSSIMAHQVKCSYKNIKKPIFSRNISKCTPKTHRWTRSSMKPSMHCVKYWNNCSSHFNWSRLFQKRHTFQIGWNSTSCWCPCEGDTVSLGMVFSVKFHSKWW